MTPQLLSGSRTLADRIVLHAVIITSYTFCLRGSRGSSASPVCSREGSHLLLCRVAWLTAGVLSHEEEEAEEGGQEVEVQQEEYLIEHEQHPRPEEIWQPAEPAVRDIPSTRAELRALGRTLFELPVAAAVEVRSYG